MSPESLCFFTIDRGTASTAVALIAPCDGRFRLLASGVSPRGTELEALLEDLVHRVEAIEPDLVPGAALWQEWARLESVTLPARRAVCAASTDLVCDDLERALAGAGWDVVGRIEAGRLDPLAATELCLDPSVAALAVALTERPSADERAAMLRLGVVLGAVLGRRPDLAVLLCGPSDAWGDDPSIAGAARLPAPEPVPLAADSALRDALRGVVLDADPFADDVAEPEAARDRTIPDGRMGLRRAIATLAALLDRRVEAVDIGHAAGSRILAHPTGVVAHVIAADAALVPEHALRDEREVDAIARWSALRSDPFTLADRLRNLHLAPWRDASGDGARLRLAALRAALGRLEAAWRSGIGTEGGAAAPGADLLVCSGGAFAAVPPPAAVLAVVDAMRRPGALTLFHDHARLLGPIGTLPDERDRRRLLADLLDDVLLPLGSAIVAGELRTGSRHPTTLRVTSSLHQQELELAPGALRLVDLPPGVQARVELETREGTVLGVRARRLALDITGGLGGLLVDTREIPLRLPDRAERRRAMLEAWERPVWAAAET